MGVAHVGLVHRDPCECKVKGFHAVSSKMRGMYQIGGTCKGCDNAALLEEEEDDDQSDDEANTTGTATPGHDDPYDIQGLGEFPVATTPTTSSQMDISPSPK